MPKVKPSRKAPFTDMTAMCDVAFLLLTFFMLATKFKPDEPVTVVTPASISQTILPDTDIMMLTVDKTGRVFFSIDNQVVRKNLINNVDEYKNLGLTEDEKNAYAIGGSLGVPFNQLKSYLAAPPDVRKEYDKSSPGIPVDSTVQSENNELAAWIRMARNNNPMLRIVIKGDSEATYPMIQNVIKTLEGWKIFKFNLITDLKGIPEGTDAYNARNASGGLTE
jgi:biopolymer transport protein ExbD